MNQPSYKFLVEGSPQDGYAIGTNGTMYYFRSGYVRNITILLEVIDGLPPS